MILNNKLTPCLEYDADMITSSNMNINKTKSWYPPKLKTMWTAVA